MFFPEQEVGVTIPFLYSTLKIHPPPHTRIRFPPAVGVLFGDETKKPTSTPSREKRSANRPSETSRRPCLAAWSLFRTGLLGVVGRFTHGLIDGFYARLLNSRIDNEYWIGSKNHNWYRDSIHRLWWIEAYRHDSFVITTTKLDKVRIEMFTFGS